MQISLPSQANPWSEAGIGDRHNGKQGPPAKRLYHMLDPWGKAWLAALARAAEPRFCKFKTQGIASTECSIVATCGPRAVHPGTGRGDSEAVLGFRPVRPGTDRLEDFNQVAQDKGGDDLFVDLHHAAKRYNMTDMSEAAIIKVS